MDTFEIRVNNRSGAGDGSRRWKSRIIVGIVGAVAVLGFTSVIVYSLLQHYELRPNGKHLHAAVADSLTDVQCEEEFCSTKGCIKAAARMMNIANTEADPCEDFYEYACGNYKRGRAPRFQQGSYDQEEEADDNIIAALKSILDTPASDDDSDSLKKTRNLFSSCSNNERRNNASLDDFIQFLHEIHLDWPLLNNNWQDDGTDWKVIVRKLEHDYKIPTLFRRHNRNRFDKEILECQTPTLPMETYLYDNKTDKPFIMKMYTDLLDFAVKSLPVDCEKREEFVAEIISLETEIALSLAESSEESEVQPSRNLVETFEEDSDRVEELIGHIQPECSGNVNKIMDVLQRQPMKVIKNYLGWRTFYNAMRYLTSDLKELSDVYIGKFPGSPPVYSPRFRECVNSVKREMGLMAAKTFLDKGYFTQEDEDELRAMLQEMKTSFVALLNSLPGMDNATLSVFQHKINSIKMAIGTEKDLRNGIPVDQLFHDLEINENDTYFRNVMKVRKYVASLLDSGHSIHTVDSNPVGTDSFFIYSRNTFDTELGFLHFPLMVYGDDYPKYLKYAHAVIWAHDISHSFDSTGALFNSQGEREGIDWWPDTVKEKFLGYVGCLRQQEVERTGLDVSKVDVEKIDEDMADLGAFAITYAGLSEHLKTHRDDEKLLPGLNLNKEQTYLLQASQMYCFLGQPRPTIDLYTKPRATWKDKLYTVIRNFEDFGAIFNCPVGSPMNPEQKCNLFR